jgi:hypothetical protein
LCSGADPPSGPSDPEVIGIDEDPVVELDPLPNRRIPYLNDFLCKVLPTDKIEARWLACHAKSFAIIKGGSTSVATSGTYSAVIPIDQGKRS